MWAEPDVEHAAALMRALADAPESAAARVEAARRRVRELYAPEAAGERLRRELARIASARGGTRPEPRRDRIGIMNGSGALTLQTAGRVLRAEGMAALRERLSDRLRESLRRRSFRAVGRG